LPGTIKKREKNKCLVLNYPRGGSNRGAILMGWAGGENSVGAEPHSDQNPTPFYSGGLVAAAWCM